MSWGTAASWGAEVWGVKGEGRFIRPPDLLRVGFVRGVENPASEVACLVRTEVGRVAEDGNGSHLDRTTVGPGFEDLGVFALRRGFDGFPCEVAQCPISQANTS